MMIIRPIFQRFILSSKFFPSRHIMTKQLVGAFLCAGLMLASTQPAAAQRGNPHVQFDGATIDEMIAAFMEEHRIPGMTLAIVQAPYISRVVGYGVSDIEKGLLASPKTLWNVGQMTQAYTAVAIMQLVEAGKLDLDDPVGKHIGKHVAGLPAEWQAVTVRQLMAHVSGLPDYTQQPSFDAAREYKPGDIIALVQGLPLAFEPGTQVANSATDFFLLGLVVEAASGMSYEAFVTKNQIERLGLKHTVFASGLAAVKQEAVEKNNFKHKDFLRERVYIDPTEAATGYAEKVGQLSPVERNSPKRWLANGSVWASAEDISLWDIGLAGELLVRKKENRDFLYNRVKLDAGHKDGTVVPAHCGWRFPGHKGLMDIQGNVPGFSCYLARFTDKSELVCVTLVRQQGRGRPDGARPPHRRGVQPKTRSTRRSAGDDVPRELLLGAGHGRSARGGAAFERSRSRDPDRPRGGRQAAGARTAAHGSAGLRQSGRRHPPDAEPAQHRGRPAAASRRLAGSRRHGMGRLPRRGRTGRATWHHRPGQHRRIDAFGPGSRGETGHDPILSIPLSEHGASRLAGPLAEGSAPPGVDRVRYI